MKDLTNNRWIAVRYFDSNLNHMGSSRSAKYDGINYNYTTGKAVELHAHFIEIDTMQPVDGTATNEYSKFLGSDYGPVIGSHGQSSRIAPDESTSAHTSSRFSIWRVHTRSMCSSLATRAGEQEVLPMRESA